MSKETIIQFVKYIFVGGTAFVADAFSLWVVKDILNINLFISTAAAFLIGLAVNYILSKIFVFKEKKNNKAAEFAAYGIIGIIGLGITELLMWIFVQKLGIYYLISKVFVAGLVLIWNFTARKILLYRSR